MPLTGINNGIKPMKLGHSFLISHEQRFVGLVCQPHQAEFNINIFYLNQLFIIF